MANTVDITGFPHAYELTAPTDRSCVLVFVHGWLLSRAYWKPLIDNLSYDYQCLSYDLRGFGESNTTRFKHARSQSSRNGNSANGLSNLKILDPNSGLLSQKPSPQELSASKALTQGYTPANYAQDLVHLLEVLNIEQAWLIGHSLGGSIALWAADLSPERVQGVSCLNSGGGIYLKEEFEKFRSVGQQLVKFRSPWFCHLPFIDRMMSRMNVASPLDPKWGRQRIVDLVTAESKAALGSLLDSTTEEEVHKLPHLVSRISQPVYFISGAQDDIMEPQYVNHLASFHTSFQCMGDNVIEIPECGHLAMVEFPDAVTRHIHTLLDKHGFAVPKEGSMHEHSS